MFLKVHESDNVNPEECAFREPTPKSHSRELLCFLTKVWSSLDSESFMPLLGGEISGSYYCTQGSVELASSEDNASCVLDCKLHSSAGLTIPE